MPPTQKIYFDLLFDFCLAFFDDFLTILDNLRKKIGSKKLGHGRQKKACAGKGGAGQLVRTLNRVPASRSDH